MLSGMITFEQALAVASSPALQAPTDFTFVLGQHTVDHDLDESPWGVDNPAFFRPATEGHLVLTGGVGIGKTVLVRDLARQAVESMEVYLFDSWHSLNHCPDDVPAPVPGLTGFSYDLPGAAAMLRTARDEVRSRTHLDARDREDLPRILVLLDDSHHLILDEYNAGVEGNRDKADAEQASASCLASLAEIAAAPEDVNATIVFASVWDPAGAAVPEELLESGFTYLNMERPFRLPTDETGPATTALRFAELTRPGFEASRILLDHRPVAADSVAIIPSCVA
jgi:nicotinamide riboside kinase